MEEPHSHNTQEAGPTSLQSKIAYVLVALWKRRSQTQKRLLIIGSLLSLAVLTAVVVTRPERNPLSDSAVAGGWSYTPAPERVRPVPAPSPTPKPNQSTGSAAAASAPCPQEDEWHPYRFHIGDDAYACDGCWMTSDEETYSTLLRSYKARDDDALAALVLTGMVKLLPAHTKMRIIDYSSVPFPGTLALYRVRVMSGSYAHESGFVRTATTKE
jgi:hypothetical protein